MEEERNIKQDVQVNRFKLEIESEQHASLYYYWSSQVPELRKKRDELKEKFKEKEAEINLKFRTGDLSLPVDLRTGKEIKLTEKVVDSCVMLNSEVMQVKKDYLEAEYQFNMAQSAENSMNQRKSMIDNLVSLYKREYYSNTEVGQKFDGNQVASDQINKQLNKKGEK